MEGLPRQDIPVVFEDGTKENIEIIDGKLKNIDLGSLADWIDEYQNKFGAGARAGRALADVFLAEANEELSEGGETFDRAETERARVAQADIVRRNRMVAEKVGLSLDFPSGDEDVEWALELRLDIANGKKFVSYLKALRKMTDSQIRGLIKVSDVLISQLTEGYDLSDPSDDRLIELVATLKDVVSEYKRIAKLNPSLDASATHFEEVSASVKDGCLKEYIFAEEHQLFDLAGSKGFGPSRWHTDMTEDHYITKWNTALKNLSELALHPKARKLYEKARDNLLSCLEYAENDMRKSKSRLLNNKIEAFIVGIKKKLQS